MVARRASLDFPPVAWLALETSDNDPARFWRYLITACQAFQVDLAQSHGALLDTTPQPPFVPPSLETVLTTLLNALGQCPSTPILLLEDYHIITSPHIPETIRTLHAQLEGWGAGLHLVKLALQRTTTPAEGEQTLTLFPRSNPSFQEYFVTEVLDLQPEPVQHFLLQTSILTRLTGSLCDAVAEQQNSQDMLTMLERANLFLEPLDTAGQWYRYHALFSEVMRNEARRRIGEDQLHHLSARASRWYEVHGFLSESIDAALYAQDYVRAAILIERSLSLQTSPGEMHEPHTLHRWLEQLPETILKQYPVLCLSYATTLLFLSASWRPSQLTLRSLEKLLRIAEQCFRAEHNLPKLGEVFAFRSLLAWRQDEPPQAARYGRQALV